MDVLKKIFLSVCFISFSSCQMGYLLKSAYYQIGILNKKVPLEKALQDPRLSEEEKRKIKLSIEVREFAKTQLALNVDQNYTSFVKLDQPYVSYVVSAAPKWKLEAYRWSYPFVGNLPYRGYYLESDAKAEEIEMQRQGFDTFLRGVSAYSTLGWLKDPLLSSMLRGKDFDLVSTIIHESVHATLFIKSQADFNERLAVFLGNKGMEMYYRLKEGPDSITLKTAQHEVEDDKKFSEFITAEVQNLEKWYQDRKGPEDESERQKRIDQISKNFTLQILPHLKTDSWKKFAEYKLNNARLMLFKTYMQDLSDFEKLYQMLGSDFVEFMKVCKSLEKSPDPEQGLKELILQHQKK